MSQVLVVGVLIKHVQNHWKAVVTMLKKRAKSVGPHLAAEARADDQAGVHQQKRVLMTRLVMWQIIVYYTIQKIINYCYKIHIISQF